jgi:cell division septal protein FtsQ
MPLSEHEQRILRQIEQELAQDPSFAERARRIPRRRLVVLSTALAVGLALTVAGLAVSFWLAFAVLLEAELRVVGRDRLANLPINAWLGGNRQPRKPA